MVRFGFNKIHRIKQEKNTINIMRLIFISQRTGSLSKLQKAMGHSSLAVSLTYLRGLEVSELEEEDMPMV